MDVPDVLDLVRPDWPPLAHVRRGWAHLTPRERDVVAQRVRQVMAAQGAPRGNRDALARFFTFLAQVETIAIEIPLRALPTATGRRRALLRRQLCDEVFHSTIFARLAHELNLPASQPPAPLASAEHLLDRIRNEPDMAVAAALLNLVAEAWIETLFRHAKSWGVADAVFAAVLEDESRHVEEAEEHMGDLDAAAALAAVRTLEQGLLEVGGEPAVGLAMLDLAGPDAYRALADDLEANHARQLAKLGLEPAPAFGQLRELRQPFEGGAGDAASLPQRVPDTPWREQARQVWDTPRDPTMQGAFDVAVGHIPKRLLTPVLVAAIGRAWAATPRLNRVVSRGRVWQIPACNVGVRVLVADDELATVVIADADKRSVRDIQRMLVDGHAQLVALRERRLRHEREGGPRMSPDASLQELIGPGPATFSVSLSNPGKFGLVSGAGAFSGAMAPSTDLTIGERRRMPVWRGVAYLPAWHVNIGCLQDHRVFDGREAGIAMSALRDQLGRRGVRAILRAPDTIAEDAVAPKYDDAWFNALPPSLRAVPMVGLWKYTPVVVGGTALAAALGVGGYILVSSLNAAGAAAGAAGGAAAGGAAAGSGGAAAGSAAKSSGAAAGRAAGATAGAATAGTAAALAADHDEDKPAKKRGKKAAKTARKR